MWSVREGGGGGGTFYPSGGQFALVQNVRGDILHGGTIRPPTPDLNPDRGVSDMHCNTGTEQVQDSELYFTTEKMV